MTIELSDTLGVILDATHRKVWFVAHGQLIGGGNPTLGLVGIDLDPSYENWAPCLNMSQSDQYRANFGQEDWVYGQPSGFTIPMID